MLVGPAAELRQSNGALGALDAASPITGLSLVTFIFFLFNSWKS